MALKSKKRDNKPTCGNQRLATDSDKLEASYFAISSPNMHQPTRSAYLCDLGDGCRMWQLKTLACQFHPPGIKAG